jgi:membrane protein implicated in regulation of membrane protease activity
MILLLAVLLAVFVAPSPWNVVIALAGVILEVGEIIWGRRLARRWRAKTGAEAMIGKRATVVSDCRPDGEVRVHGELWAASCAKGAGVGDTVRIEALDGLTLIVTPLSVDASAPSAITR